MNTLGRLFTLASVAASWLILGARLLLELIGYSTAPDDAKVAGGIALRLVDWLLGVPPWTLILTAFILTTVIAWRVWPRASAHSNKLEPDKPQVAQRPDTRLRLSVNLDGSRHFVEEYQSNVTHWQQTLFSMKKQSASDESMGIHMDTLSLVFDVPIEFERPIVEAKGGRLGGYNFYALGNKGAVFQFFGDGEPANIDIWFPPVGYYQSRSAANQERFSQHLPQLNTEAKMKH